MLALQLRPPPRQVLGAGPAVLADVLRDDVNLSVWQRRLPAQLEDFCMLLLASGEALAESRVIDFSADWRSALADLAPGFAGAEGHAAFVADVIWLVEAFSELLDVRRVGLRLRVLDQAMCPRFHVDHVPVRLVSTYAGLASQWLEEGAMDRRRLGDPAAEPGDATRIHSLQAGDVALLKGERWEGNEGAGLIHRSPQPQPGERRLLLTLDWLA